MAHVASRTLLRGGRPGAGASQAGIAGFDQEVRSGDRFEFGKNWTRFLTTLTDERVHEAERSLQEMLECTDLKGKRFLDVGSGSGLFSLAARRLGAQVHSYDYDPQSVACTMALRDAYFPSDEQWQVEAGSVLDANYLKSLGTFDIVYSWGVLHHTGDMWAALSGACSLVARDGRLFIAIYNDEGWKSRAWWRVKKAYCSGRLGRGTVTAIFVPCFLAETLLRSLLKRKNLIRDYKRRGMSIFHDWIDWLGGFPYEVAKAEDVFRFARDRGFVLTNLRTTNSLGNNQFVFCRK